LTVRDLLRRSFYLIGVLAEGETPSADMLKDGMASLGEMLDSWSTESLNIPAKVREEFPLVADKASYTMGPLADLDTARPVDIEYALVRHSDGQEVRLAIVSLAEWSDIALKSTGSTAPYKLFVEGTSPALTLRPWPVPNADSTLVLYSEKPLLSIVNGNTEVELPPGYSRAIRYNLAIEMAPEYGKTVSAEVATIAGESKANIKRKNISPAYLKCDGALTRGRPFNIYTGG